MATPATGMEMATRPGERHRTAQAATLVQVAGQMPLAEMAAVVRVQVAPQRAVHLRAERLRVVRHQEARPAEGLRAEALRVWAARPSIPMAMASQIRKTSAPVVMTRRT